MHDTQDATHVFLAEHARTHADDLTDLLVKTIERDNPGYRAAGVVPRVDLWNSCRDNIGRVLELLALAVAEHGLPRATRDSAYDAARETGRRRAEQGLPLDDVLRSYRLGGRLIWDDLVESGEQVLDAHALREIGTRLWEVVDETSAQVAVAYHLHARDMVRADEQQRAELWEGLLSGRAREPGFALEVSRLLDLPMDADVVVVTAADLDLRDADRRLGPHATAWVRRAGGVVGVVALRDLVPDEALAALADVAELQQRPVGVSTVMAGLAFVDEGYRQASLALRAQGRTPSLAAFDARLPEAMLLSAPDVAARLVNLWVRPIQALGPPEAEALLETLAAWVGCGGSASRAAAEVHCHRNTIVNRLRRAEIITGRQLSDEAPPLDLDLALRAWQMGLGHV